MRRIFVILSSVFGILILTSIFLVFARSWVLSAILSSKFQTLVTVEQLTFSQGNQIDLAHLSIDNPDTFQSTHALEVQSIAITAPYREFFNTAIHIDTIALDGIVITVDFVGKTTNWEVLISNLSNQQSSLGNNSFTVIDTLVLHNMQLRVIKGTGAPQLYTLNDITLHNITTENGSLTRRISQAIVTQMILQFQDIIAIPFTEVEKAFDFLSP